ncbi:hypothetical protein M3Y99_01039000 [Aphelenchoides fujianensis]|nr:hypothetical protein M3Y99_01039000 [Aphelenchoides fujianensis]
MKRGIRKFGWSYTIKWALLIGGLYLTVLYIGRQDTSGQLDDGGELRRAPIPVPRPRRLDVQIVNDAANLTGNQAVRSDDSDQVIAILVFCATRDRAIRNHLQQLVEQRPDSDRFPIYVSQDADTQSVRAVIEEFANKSKNIHYMHHTHQSPQTPFQRSAKAYFHISTHYKWALDRVFANHSTVLDFFSFFTHTRQLLEEDPTVWCVSAWNDNGGSAVTDQAKSELLYRTDFFPGLGWMLKADVWRELSAAWPEAYWDDWMRRPEIRKNRVCIRPEVSRTAHNNQLAGKGSSGGLYKSFLASIHLPQTSVDFSLVDMSRNHKAAYDQSFRQQLLDAKPISIAELFANPFAKSEGDPSAPRLSPQFAYRVTYNDPREFRTIARKFKLMEDFRSGMPRTAYYGVVTFLADHVRIYAVHANLNLTEELGETPADRAYDVKWDLMTRYLDFASMYCKAGKWTGTCDPKSPEMREWFERRHQKKRLEAWGEMIVF